MKTFSRFLLPFLIALPLLAAPKDSVLKLPGPQTDIGKPIMTVLKERHSSRVYDTKPLSMQDLSNLLWAGFGINRPETGGRTAPSAVNRQEIDLYVALAKGIYRYEAKENILRLVVAGDLREMTGTQPFVKGAPCDIIFVVDRSREGNGRSWAEADAAFISENIYLYCASQGLATVIRASVDQQELGQAMKLAPTQEVIFGQSVGYEMEKVTK